MGKTVQGKAGRDTCARGNDIKNTLSKLKQVPQALQKFLNAEVALSVYPVLATPVNSVFSHVNKLSEFKNRIEM